MLGELTIGVFLKCLLFMAFNNSLINVYDDIIMDNGGEMTPYTQAIRPTSFPFCTSF